MVSLTHATSAYRELITCCNVNQRRSLPKWFRQLQTSGNSWKPVLQPSNHVDICLHHFFSRRIPATARIRKSRPAEQNSIAWSDSDRLATAACPHGPPKPWLKRAPAQATSRRGARLERQRRLSAQPHQTMFNHVRDRADSAGLGPPSVRSHFVRAEPCRADKHLTWRNLKPVRLVVCSTTCNTARFVIDLVLTRCSGCFETARQTNQHFLVSKVWA
jgi:hypothetical protein